jgi:UDP-glucose 4-epimerase
MAKYLVTGGCGFIGSHLVDALLAANHQVIILDDLSAGKEMPSNATFIKASICDSKLVHDVFEEIDGCFHLAAIPSITKSNDDWIGTHQVNLTGTITVLDAAAKMRKSKTIPVVYASSSAVYGDNPTIPANEAEKPTPISAYGADKYAGELHARIAGLIHQVPTFSLRFFNVYGPRQRADSPYSGVISVFIDHMQHHQPLLIYGDGLQERDFIYVSDVVDHCLAAMKVANCDAPVVNVCRGQDYTLLKLIEELSKLYGYQPEIQMLPARKGDIYCSMGDPTLAKKLLSLSASIPLHSGLKKLIESMH